MFENLLRAGDLVYVDPSVPGLVLRRDGEDEPLGPEYDSRDEALAALAALAESLVGRREWLPYYVIRVIS